MKLDATNTTRFLKATLLSKQVPNRRTDIGGGLLAIATNKWRSLNKKTSKKPEIIVWN